MKTGTQQIKETIMRELKKHNARLDGIRYGVFAENLAEQIYNMVGDDDMSKKDFDLAHGVSDAESRFIKKLENGLGGYLFKRTPEALEVYRWAMTQPEHVIQEFFKWAQDTERKPFIGKYKNNPGAIKFDIEQLSAPKNSFFETIS